MMQMIARQLLVNPHGIAIVNPQGRWRYGDIALRVGAVVGALRQLRPTSVLIYGHKECDTVAALLACAWCSVPFTVADSVNPPLRTARIAAMYGADLILDGRADAQTSPFSAARTLALSALPDAALASDYSPPAAANALFYVLSTSGSTGQPKGVRVGCDNFGAFFAWYHRLFAAIGGDGGHLNHARLSFDMGLLDVFTCFALGRPLVMLPHDYNALPRLNLNLMTAAPEVQVTTAFSTPSFLDIMCRDPRFNAERLPHFQATIVGGEFVPPQLVARLRQRFPSLTFYHAYGPTETACVTHIHAIDDAAAAAAALLPLGRPLGRNRILIEDETGQPLPPGETGEVVIYGDQVGQGYLPASHPKNAAFGMRDGVPFYRTGDLGWLDNADSLFIKGRIDSQVKWNGNRIDLQEIDAAACSFAQTVMATSVPIWQQQRLAEIVLFVQLKQQDETACEAFWAHLNQQLPRYMIPTAVRYLVAFPLNQNGKIDRQALLPLVDSAQPENSTAQAG